MNNDTKDDLFFMLIGFGFGFIIATALIGMLNNSYWYQQIIEHKAGYYNPESGKFTWKNNEVSDD